MSLLALLILIRFYFVFKGAYVKDKIAWLIKQYNKTLFKSSKLNILTIVMCIHILPVLDNQRPISLNILK